MKNCSWAFAAMLLLACLCASARAACPDELRNLNLQDMQGKKAALSCTSQRVLVVNLWATWCVPCRIEIPRLIALHREFKNKGVAVVGISVDALPPSELKPFIKTFNIPYPVYIGKAREVLAGVGIMAVPATIIVDGTGAVKHKLIGLHTTDELRRIIKNILSQETKSSL